MLKLKSLTVKYALLSILPLAAISVYVAADVIFTRHMQDEVRRIELAAGARTRLFRISSHGHAVTGVLTSAEEELHRKALRSAMEEYEEALHGLRAGSEQRGAALIRVYDKASLSQLAAVTEQWEQAQRPVLLALVKGEGARGKESCGACHAAVRDKAGMIDDFVESLKGHYAGEREQFEKLRFAGLGLLLATAVFVFLFAKRTFIMPVKRLRAAVSEIDKGNFGVTVEAARGDELGELAESFNGLSRGLRSAFAENARLIRNLQTIHEASKDVLSELDIHALLQKIADNARNLIACRYAAIGILNEQGGYEYFVPSGLEPAAFEALVKKHGLPRGKGLLGHLLREGRPIRLDDLSRHSASTGFPEGHPLMRTFLGAPISLRDKVIGRLYFSEKRGGAFTDEDEHLAVLMADTAAQAIQNARLLAEISSKKDDLAVLNKLSSALSGSLSVDDTVQCALDEVLNHERLRVEKKGALFLADEKTRTLRLAAHRGFSEELARSEAELPYGHCLCGLVAESGEAVLSEDCLGDRRHTVRYAGMARHGHVNLPLKARDALLGVLCLYLPPGVRPTEEEKKLFLSLAGIISVALENALTHRRAAMLAQSLDSSNDVVVITDAEGRITHVNPEAVRELGYSTDELVGKPVSIMQSPRNPPALGEEIFRKTLEGGWRGEVVNRRKDGSEFPVLLTTSFVKDAHGRIIALTGIARDITERKRAEAELKKYGNALLALNEASNALIGIVETENIHRAICEGARALFRVRMVWLGLLREGSYAAEPAAFAGDDGGYLSSVNATWDDSPSGMGPAGMAIKTQEASVCKVDDERFAPWAPEARQRGFASVLGVPLIRARKECIGALLLYSERDDFFSEEVVRLCRIFANQAAAAIENARLVEGLEEQIRRRTSQLEEANLELQAGNHELEMRRLEAEGAKMIAESADRAKSDFLANMSHELRTPLNSILGFSELMIEGMTGPLSPKQVEYARDIYESGALLLSLINDILDLSKVEAGKMDLTYEKTSPRELIDRVLVLFREKTQKHGLRLTVELGEGVGPFFADERRIRQVLLNLLSNAVKFSPDNGSVRIAAWKRRGQRPAGRGFAGADAGPDAVWLGISVANTGPGIKAEDLPKLFKPFQQLEASYEKKHQGTGLGLALCKRIVELHGGRIWAESEPGRETVFTFVIPAGNGPAGEGT